MTTGHLLVIDDEAGHRLMVRAVMEDAGWRVSEAASAEAALDFVRQASAADLPNVALLDMRMPGMDGLEALAALRELAPGMPVVMLTAYATVGVAVEAMKRGAFDYLTKPADNEELKAVLAKAREYGALLEENRGLRAGAASRRAMRRLVGGGAAMRAVRELCEQVGPAEATVLILGESGTGKELAAELIHAMSPRASGPLVKVNCAALPADLLESELFGYVKGAFTGAVKDKPGRFQLANKGTLFLDEVGELPLALQAKFLRALQERVVEPLGSVKPVATDVRILAATNRDLAVEAKAGHFREDLYFRLAVLEIRMPPLRERLEDLPELAAFLLEKLTTRNNKVVRAVSPAFLERLAAHDWPGNVRELENVLERAIILSRTDVLEPSSLPPALGRGPGRCAPASGDSQPVATTPSPASSLSESLDASLDEAERQALERALDANQGHRENTARMLGISRRTLQYKLRKYGLVRK
ncbi:sigma-54 dependent transcriptional regulator [Fundidesulfovibrio butyratiphilus]